VNYDRYKNNFRVTLAKLNSSKDGIFEARLCLRKLEEYSEKPRQQAIGS